MKTIAIDFDGVLHSYKSGWQGPDKIPDPPVPGAIDWLDSLVECFRVVIFSSRGINGDGKWAMQRWLEEHGSTAVPDIEFVSHKPPAHVIIDDRAMRFDGEHFPTIDEITSFKPWWKTQ